MRMGEAVALPSARRAGLGTHPDMAQTARDVPAVSHLCVPHGRRKPRDDLCLGTDCSAELPDALAGPEVPRGEQPASCALDPRGPHSKTSAAAGVRRCMRSRVALQMHTHIPDGLQHLGSAQVCHRTRCRGPCLRGPAAGQELPLHVVAEEPLSAKTQRRCGFCTR